MENAETKLAVDYEAIRRREYELITELLDVLPKVDNLPEERIAQVRDALFHADHPYLMVFVGPFSSGKSSIINALLGQGDLLPVGVTPTTDRISILRWGEEAQRVSAGGDVDTIFHPSPLLKKVSFVDTPGLESVFQKHEETTRRFLHRSDVVLLVMLATQAMTARNQEYLQTLKDYGKKVIIVINQVDLLTPEELETVKAYVQDQSKSVMGVVPEIWLISAKKGLAAGQGESRSEEQWEASGLVQVEDYIDDQLGDVDRMRQKLRTPLQITQNVNSVALEAVRANQGILDQYQNISENIEQQLASQKREQERIIQDVSDQVSGKFGAAGMNGSEAIRDVFSLSRSFGSLGRGLLEMVGLGGLGRGGQSYIAAAFNRHQAFKPIDELPSVVDKLAPRLEGKDIQDMDDLVKYAQREIQQLPEAIRGKVIGQVQSPLKYEREHLQKVRPQLEMIENEARVVETERLDQTLRNTLLYLVVYEILVIVVGFFLSQAFAQVDQLPVILIVVLALVLLGLAFVPLRGRLLESSYTQHMLELQRRYLSLLESAAEKQVAYGMQLRQDAIAPLTRLIEAQTKIQTGQLDKLLTAQQEITNIEAALTKMGKRNLLVR
ncbi:MAG: dynamin family protein [Anaerolineae bacterium]|nr:dynamin family protein [Anaerolineae bacterium]